MTHTSSPITLPPIVLQFIPAAIPKRQVNATPQFIESSGSTTGTCPSGAIFTLENGHLFDNGLQVSTDGKATSAVLKGLPTVGKINSTFIREGGILHWRNTAFDGGDAVFCLNGSIILAIFKGSVPKGCTRGQLSIADCADFEPRASDSSTTGSIISSSTSASTKTLGPTSSATPSSITSSSTASAGLTSTNTSASNVTSTSSTSLPTASCGLNQVPGTPPSTCVCKPGFVDNISPVAPTQCILEGLLCSTSDGKTYGSDGTSCICQEGYVSFPSGSDFICGRAPPTYGCRPPEVLDPSTGLCQVCTSAALHDKSIGCCFQDTFRNYPFVALSGGFGASSVLTPSLCASMCSIYTYFGTYGGDSCFCFNTFDMSTPDIYSSCNIPCPGDISKSCGGQNHAPLNLPVWTFYAV